MVRSAFAARLLLLALLAAPLVACAGRPGPEVLRPAAAVDGARKLTILVATTRGADPAEPTQFTSRRSLALRYARYVIAVPPNRKPSQTERPSGPPDPRTSFTTVEAKPLTAAQFRAEAAAQARNSVAGAGAGIFVHGFNYNFQESLFRAAQLFTDIDFGGAQILFAWPSDASPVGYVADKDAVTVSRDALTEVVDGLTSEPAVGRVAIVSHSMGSWLTMEAIRQLRLMGKDKAIARLFDVILAAPDIDVDVFAKQLEVVGRLDPPLTVLVAKDDGALRLSTLLAGNRSRVGLADIDDPRVQAAAKRYDVRVVDLSKVASSGDLNHSRYASVAAIYPTLGDHLEKRGRGSLAGTGVFLLSLATSRAGGTVGGDERGRD